ncbi:uncharacterized protein LOC129005676 [Macrosteles quadrilineatus]|uniref:uncharacterized protein LOC129005676 n=1 Tax=Macrosteles quadrilineatus TaxID=74068 RepID=UPI0023E26127|nr:uncharacterized protein LOC129005676 [Macrosteles quadrilineatus]XP_054290613.1 uncharacterized protein LOC129005676 [Macrosteles quadrilineatus]
MKCSISGCPNIYDKKNSTVSFHKFPNNPEILTVWVAATGTLDFIPTHGSKVCSDHFAEKAYKNEGNRRFLTPRAVPTKSLSEEAATLVKNQLTAMGKYKQDNNTMACILGNDTTIKQVSITRDPTDLTTPQQEKVQAPASIKVVDMKNLLEPQPEPTALVANQVCSTEPKTAAAANPMKSHANKSSTNSVKSHVNISSRNPAKSPVNKSSINPVKSLVNKSSITINPVDSQVQKCPIKKTSECKYPINHLKPTTASLVSQTGVSTSLVLSCLKVILPGKFDFSRMIPNEKVVSLVIRYMKLNEHSEDIYNVVKDHLNIIIEGAKTIDKKSVDFANHPYTNISDRDLKEALNVILPIKFSMVDITDELLALICINLDLDIHSDAYYILIGKIRKFTSEGQMFSEILNLGDQVDKSLEIEKSVEESNHTSIGQEEKASPEPPQDENPDIKPEFENKERMINDAIPPCESNIEDNDVKLPVNSQQDGEYNDVKHPVNGQQTPDNHLSTSSEDTDLSYSESRSRVDKDWDPKSNTENIRKNPINPDHSNLINIVNFLHANHRSARQIFANTMLMFKLCRYLDKRPHDRNMKELETKLKYIIDNNITRKNLHQFVPIKKKFKPKIKKNAIPKINQEKLKMKPIVVLNDVFHFTQEEIFLNKEKEKQCHKEVRYSQKPRVFNITYSTELVMKKTDESYKQFRKITSKNVGNKLVFYKTFAKLAPGTIVYAKNYRLPRVGWVKGYISKQVGPLKYKVQLDDDYVWICTCDQLRPLMNQFVNHEKRRGRSVKPKQLMDL